ncbi:MAG: L,D-transpeptidase family protein [Gammaproteobacteria bacterium]
MAIVRSLVVAAILMSIGCSQLPWQFEDGDTEALPGHLVNGNPLPPLSTSLFLDIPEHTEVLGGLQVIEAHRENTFSAIAREYGLGYDELKIANPGIDPWLPGDGTRIYLPTMMIIPDVERAGVVVNLPSLRLLHFQTSSVTESLVSIENYAIGIGREGWATPTGNFHITEKVRDPNWYPPASVKKEHAKMGDPLPDVVPPGPDNPLGRFKMRLSNPEYLIHGTNKPSGVGMRVSHGCIRLYPENIAELFENAPKNTKVQIVNQPVLAGWRNRQLFLEVHPQLVEDKRDIHQLAEQEIAKALQKSPAGVSVNQKLIDVIIAEKRGLPFPITSTAASVDSYLTSARTTVNIVPRIQGAKTASR